MGALTGRFVSVGNDIILWGFFAEPRTTLSTTVITAAIKNGRVYTITTLSTRRAWGLSAWLIMVHRRLLIEN